MTSISASQVKELREKTGAGMMDAKKALTENNGDMEAAVDWLRKKGLATAQKKAGRAASEGLVCLTTQGNVGAMVEVNAETDFVSRNEHFQNFVQTVARVALENKGNLEKIKAAPYPNKNHSVEEELTELIATIGENMTIRRAAALSCESGAVVSYMHNSLADDMGKIGVLVALESSADISKLESVGKHLAMHIAATNPASLDKESLDTELIEREKKVLADQARASGKPEEIIEKMVEGRLRKYYEEVVLLEQTFVIDGESKVAEFLQREMKEVGEDIKVTGFVRFALGEGVEKKEENFADEVKKMTG